MNIFSNFRASVMESGLARTDDSPFYDASDRNRWVYITGDGKYYYKYAHSYLNITPDIIVGPNGIAVTLNAFRRRLMRRIVTNSSGPQLNS